MNRKLRVEFVDGGLNHYYWGSDYYDDGTRQWINKIVSLAPITTSMNPDRTWSVNTFDMVVDDADGIIAGIMADDTKRKLFTGWSPYALMAFVEIYVYSPDQATLLKTIYAEIVGASRHYSLVTFTLKIASPYDFFCKPDAVIDSTTFPNAATEAIGQPIQEPYGILGWGDYGTVKCWKVDAGKYLIGRTQALAFSTVWTVDAVFHDGILLDPASYTITNESYGSIVNYSAGAADYIAVNGHFSRLFLGYESVTNPVTLLRGALSYNGMQYFNIADTWDFAGYCTTNNWGAAFLLREIQSLSTIIQTWCRTFDAWAWPTLAGGLEIRHVDWSGETRDATLIEADFVAFAPERADASHLVNIGRGFWNYDWVNNRWTIETVTGSPNVDCPSSNGWKEESFEYLYGYFVTPGGTNPAENYLRWNGRPVYTIEGTVQLDTWEAKGLGNGRIAHITHPNQLSGPGLYLITELTLDLEQEQARFKAIRLWYLAEV